MEITTTLIFNMRNEGTLDEESDGGGQFFDCPIVPRVGEEVFYFTTRDENGNYDPRGEVIQRFKGTVEKVDYSFEERGHDSYSNRKKVYVTIYLRND